MSRYDVAIGLATVVLVLGGCSDGELDSRPEPGTPSSLPATTTTPTTASPTESDPTAIPDPPVPAFSTERAMETVEFLAGEVGPRLATGAAFRRAARWVARELESIGYDVSTQTFAVPAGDSWGVPVQAGTSTNVVAQPEGFDTGSPYVVIGAHLDTVAVSPGAEDNASGISVLLETARRAAAAPLRLPVVFVAFGGEEPRGEGDFDHHFGSVHYVAQMTPAERRSLRGMVAMDRVGVGTEIPIGSVPGATTTVRDALAGAAARIDIGTSVGLNNVSDHESFADEGMPAARLGGTDFPEYHERTDLPGVVSPDQLRSVGRVIWEWLRRAR